MKRYIMMADDGRYFCWGAVNWTANERLATRFMSFEECPAEICCGHLFGEYLAVRERGSPLYYRAKNGSLVGERDNRVEAVVVAVEF